MVPINLLNRSTPKPSAAIDPNGSKLLCRGRPPRTAVFSPTSAANRRKQRGSVRSAEILANSRRPGSVGHLAFMECSRRLEEPSRRIVMFPPRPKFCQSTLFATAWATLGTFGLRGGVIAARHHLMPLMRRPERPTAPGLGACRIRFRLGQPFIGVVPRLRPSERTACRYAPPRRDGYATPGSGIMGRDFSATTPSQYHPEWILP